MLPKRYAAETKILVGRFVNHDDNLEDEDLTVNLKLTQRLWQEAFGVPYLNPTAAPPVISHQQLLVKKKALGGMGAGLMLTSLAAVALLSPVSEPAQQAQQAQQVSTRSPNKKQLPPLLTESNHRTPHPVDESHMLLNIVAACDGCSVGTSRARVRPPPATE